VGSGADRRCADRRPCRHDGLPQGGGIHVISRLDLIVLIPSGEGVDIAAFPAGATRPPCRKFAGSTGLFYLYIRLTC
jgi:hypothetical protein